MIARLPVKKEQSVNPGGIAGSDPFIFTGAYVGGHERSWIPHPIRHSGRAG